MNKYFLLKLFRKLYVKVFSVKENLLPKAEQNKSLASKLILDILLKDEPCMVARFGSTELSCLENYIGINNSSKNIIKYIKGDLAPWWWETNIINQMEQWSGFFPPTIDNINLFGE